MNNKLPKGYKITAKRVKLDGDIYFYSCNIWLNGRYVMLSPFICESKNDTLKATRIWIGENIKSFKNNDK